MKLHWLLASATTVLLLGNSAAQAGDSSWRCTFQGMEEPMTFIDLGKGRGKLVGNIGTNDVFVLTGATAVSFIEPLESGAAQLTTIVISTGEAAHSRNTVLAPALAPDGQAKFMPSQVMGNCQPWQ